MTYVVYCRTSLTAARFSRVGQAETLDDAAEIAARQWRALIDQPGSTYVDIRIQRSPK